MIISTDAERACNKSKYTFMIKILSKLGLEENFLNIIKAIYGKHTANTVNDERLKALPLRLETR